MSKWKSKHSRICFLCKKQYIPTASSQKFCSRECFKIVRARYSRNLWYKTKFGIGLDEYEQLYVEQDGKCRICGSTEISERNGTRKTLAVDHDHETKKVRGLLCESCNLGLGKFRDNISILECALKYLKDNRNG